ncbi:MAG: 16S rRNA (cytosine(1402)-N(4))-methyltransferase RsmH, partial [Candidatus Omnitrophota bacterium]
GEEKFSRRIAHTLVEQRRCFPITTTKQLSDLILDAVPSRYRHMRIHPATRIFQALRIAVNRELDSLEVGLKKAVDRLSKHGRIVVISFHSLEDRIVKHIFRDFTAKGVLQKVTKKPLTPSEGELNENSRSRSAKMRVAEKIL